MSNTFKKKALAFAVSTVITGASTTSAAQTGIDEEVLVTGVRSSFAKALENKREARAIVDSIASEELGRFPDSNVADSLSHMPGITVSRGRNGAATGVKIRGLGEEFNLTTLNGRYVATDGVGRSFQFDVLPSEVISGADVWKTSSAKQEEGSVGGLINLKTVRPLDTPGLHATVSLDADHNSLSKNWGNSIGGVFTNTFADDTVGVMLGFTHSSGDRRSDGTSYISYRKGEDLGEWDSYIEDNNRDGYITDDEYVSTISSLSWGTYAEQFERTGLNGAIQWAPNERLEFTLDFLQTSLNSSAQGWTNGFYASELQDGWQELSINENGDTAWFYEGVNVDGETFPDGESAETDQIIIRSSIPFEGRQFADSITAHSMSAEVVLQDEYREVDTYLYGFNAAYQATDKLSLSLDLYQSKSERPGAGKNNFLVAGVHPDTDRAENPNEPVHQTTWTANNSGMPDLTSNWNVQGVDTFDDFGDEHFSPHWSSFSGDSVVDTINGLKIDGKLDLNTGPLASIEFGISHVSREKDRKASGNDHPENGGACNYCSYPYTFAGAGASVMRDFPYDNMFEGESGNFQNSFPVFDMEAYYDSLAAADGQTLPLSPGVSADSFGINRDDASIDSWGDYGFVDGDTAVTDAMVAAALADGTVVTSESDRTISYPSNYSDGWLPSPDASGTFVVNEENTALYIQANFEGDLWFGNAGLRQVETSTDVTFANADLLSVTVSGQGTPNAGYLANYSPTIQDTASASYTKLLPSLNFGLKVSDDVIVRAAYAEAMARPEMDQLVPFKTDDASDGGTDINVEGNVNLQPYFSEQLDLIGEWYFAEDSLISGSLFWKDVTNFIVGNTTQVQIPRGPAGNLTDSTYNYHQPVNADSASFQGMELRATYWTKMGLGVDFSYAYTKSEAVVEGEDIGALPGIAPQSYSLALMYENDTISAVLGMDHTGRYRTDITSELGAGYNTWQESGKIVTASLRYSITDNLDASFDIWNLTNESDRGNFGQSWAPEHINVYGRDISLGVSYNF